MSGTQTSNSSQAVTPGNWVTQTINGMQYDVLLPANYDPSIKYPTVLYLHQLDMGNDPSGLLAEVDPWFNTTAFRTSTPAIVVMPLLDQSADPSGETINFGGVSSADSAGETNAIAALKQVMAQYSSDASRIYVTGNSMGGIGTEDMLIKYNAYTGTEGKLFAAGLALAGADYGQGYPQPDPSIVAALKNVPFWAIHGGQDTTVPLTWDQNLYAAEQAIGGDMQYTQDNSLGHDVWDTYYPQAGAGSPLGWLFSQSTGGSGVVTSPPPPPPPPASPPSANDTVVMGTSGSITDASGNKWTINTAGQVAVNGAADTMTANAKELAYVNGTIWQENTSNLWWGETQNNDAWAPSAGTATSPLPATTTTPPPPPPPPPAPTPSANDTVVMGTSGSITDASGNKWTINAAGQVAVNGAADSMTANVKELAYVNGTIWQENTSNLWWGETQNNDAWAPSAGTATSPLPATTTTPPPPPPPPPPAPTSSANDTVVMGTSGSITDAGGNKWTINAGGQVAVNGTADTMTANVKELAYVNGTIWQENASNLWWGETQNNDAWAPSAGTATSPLPAVTTPPPPPPPPPPAGTIGSGSDTIVLTMSEDADGPTGAAGADAEFTLNVDGQQIGGLQTVTASHTAGQTETFTFQGNFAPGKHAITVTFANNSMTAGDKAAFNDGGDRNVYVNGVTYDGSVVSSTVTGIYQSPFYAPLNTGATVYGNAVYAVTDTTAVPAGAPSTPSTTPAAVSFGTGADTLTLGMSEDPYQGDAQFTVSVDGTQVGGTFTTSAIEWQGQTQPFVLHGSWGNGPHTVSIAYINDQIGPPDARGTYDSVDRNLFINSVSYDGTTVTSAPYGLFNNGSHSFSVPTTTASPPPPPPPPPTVTASPNDTMVLAGSAAAITDAAGNKWTITSAGQVAVNGVADTTTGHVTELAYVGKAVWQENTSNLWWGKTSPTAAWAPGAGTSTSPLPAPITIASGTTSATVSQSQVSVVATAGNHMLFLSGSGDIVSLSGGTDTITDTGKRNTYMIPSAGKGTDTFTSNILTSGDTLDLKTALGGDQLERVGLDPGELPDGHRLGDKVRHCRSRRPRAARAWRSRPSTARRTLTLSSLLAHAIT